MAKIESNQLLLWVIAARLQAVNAFHFRVVLALGIEEEISVIHYDKHLETDVADEFAIDLLLDLLLLVHRTSAVLGSAEHRGPLTEAPGGLTHRKATLTRVLLGAESSQAEPIERCRRRLARLPADDTREPDTCAQCHPTRIRVRRAPRLPLRS